MSICFLAIGVRIWIKGKFADTEVGHNPDMHKLGLCCVKEEEMRLWKKKNINSQSSPDCGYCSTCCSNSERRL
ncbi:MAG: hypothetical protein LBL90_01815 [Prevotellaceae bacterium]|nr:hypothetical protein [Prevotellaceae bacterium]